jgi:hypothetical protein
MGRQYATPRWVFEEGSFRPAAKLTEDKKYSIITDYLGTPVQMYDEKGQLIWEARLDMYGKVANFVESSFAYGASQVVRKIFYLVLSRLIY